ncbi:MAG: hypothetical protein IJA66_01860 [Alistipes sp.]|nr:hypothetical protein [Alistipes sp.]
MGLFEIMGVTVVVLVMVPYIWYLIAVKRGIHSGRWIALARKSNEHVSTKRLFLIPLCICYAACGVAQIISGNEVFGSLFLLLGVVMLYDQRSRNRFRIVMMPKAIIFPSSLSWWKYGEIASVSYLKECGCVVIVNLKKLRAVYPMSESEYKQMTAYLRGRVENVEEL